jgi:hypothetical protein
MATPETNVTAVVTTVEEIHAEVRACYTRVPQNIANRSCATSRCWRHHHKLVSLFPTSPAHLGSILLCALLHSR